MAAPSTAAASLPAAAPSSIPPPPPPPPPPPSAIKPTSRARIYRIPNTSDHVVGVATATVVPQHGGGGGSGGSSGHAPPTSHPVRSVGSTSIGGGGSASEGGKLDGNITKNSGGNTNTNTTAITATSTAAPPPPESFLWATREMAALDFLMNVPLNAEKDIVRAGLSEGSRWLQQHGRYPATSSIRQQQQQQQQSRAYSTATGTLDQDVVYDEENNKHHWTMMSSSQPHPRSLSAFDITADDNDVGVGRMSETTTILTESSSLHAIENNKHHHHHPTGTGGGGTAAAGGGGGGGGGGGRWWDKLILKDKRFFSVANQVIQRREQMELEEKELERPTESPSLLMMSSNDGNLWNASQYNNTMGMMGTTSSSATPTAAGPGGGGVPGRRLDGIEAVTITIPPEFRRRPAPLRAAARQAAVREWEIRVAYGTAPSSQHGGPTQRLVQQHHLGVSGVENPTTPTSNTRQRQALLDGRVFFSTKKSYPVAVFSTIKYEPKKEETLRRRKQLEELGGGGTQFVLPERDWSESITTFGGGVRMHCPFCIVLSNLLSSFFPLLCVSCNRRYFVQSTASKTQKGETKQGIQSPHWY